MIDLHWRYFLSIAEDLAKVSRYVEFTPANDKVYSIEFLRLLLSAGAECDVLLKDIAGRYATLPERPNISHYQSAVATKFPKLHTVEVYVPRFGLTLKPWASWSAPASCTSPGWWNAYNAAKHDKQTNFAEATLRHTLDSTAALFVLGMTVHAIASSLDDLNNLQPELFTVTHSPNTLLANGLSLPEITDSLP